MEMPLLYALIVHKDRIIAQSNNADINLKVIQFLLNKTTKPKQIVSYKDHIYYVLIDNNIRYIAVSDAKGSVNAYKFLDSLSNDFMNHCGDDHSTTPEYGLNDIFASHIDSSIITWNYKSITNRNNISDIMAKISEGGDLQER
jgi:hypothetical protein